MHELPPGDAERPLRHLWLRACFFHCEMPLTCSVTLLSPVIIQFLMPTAPPWFNDSAVFDMDGKQ